jgi:aryl sulfotransferase
MPALVRPAVREYRTWAFDSRRWDRYRPREGDIVIATYPKCGTTWTERIVQMLLLQSTEARPIRQFSTWIDARFREPLDDVIALLDAKQDRRLLKSHIPLDGLPLFDGVQYIHVARDGRDAWASYYNHRRSFTSEALARFDQIGTEDNAICAPYPRASPDPREDFREWLGLGNEQARVAPDFFHFVGSFWGQRHRPNILLVHYNDLSAELEQEMRRIAAFLRLECAEALWPQLVRAAGFEEMRKDGEKLMPQASSQFVGGARSFFFQGRNGRWRDMLGEQEIALYQARVKKSLSAECARWAESGRVIAGDPQRHCGAALRESFTQLEHEATIPHREGFFAMPADCASSA